MLYWFEEVTQEACGKAGNRLCCPYPQSCESDHSMPGGHESHHKKMEKTG